MRGITLPHSNIQAEIKMLPWKFRKISYEIPTGIKAAVEDFPGDPAVTPPTGEDTGLDYTVPEDSMCHQGS